MKSSRNVQDKLIMYINTYKSYYNIAPTYLWAGPALTIAGPYAKRIAWGPVCLGIRIITEN